MAASNFGNHSPPRSITPSRASTPRSSLPFSTFKNQTVSISDSPLNLSISNSTHMTSMDPTPSPVDDTAKIPVTTKKKAVSRLNPSKEPNVVSARYRQPPRRVFGTVRNANIPPEKPQPSKKASAKDPKKPSDTGKIAKPFARKPVAVVFQEPNEPCSPLPTLVRPLAPETPFHSALNCSDCRLDRLESASYWITQIKLAESVGRHAVSAAFFRLASECRAEPSRRLRIELRSYAERHGLASEDWSEVRRLYGLSGERSEAGSGAVHEAVPSVAASFCGSNCVDHAGKHLDCGAESLLDLSLEDGIKEDGSEEVGEGVQGRDAATDAVEDGNVGDDSPASCVEECSPEKDLQERANVSGGSTGLMKDGLVKEVAKSVKQRLVSRSQPGELNGKSRSGAKSRSSGKGMPGEKSRSNGKRIYPKHLREV